MTPFGLAARARDWTIVVPDAFILQETSGRLSYQKLKLDVLGGLLRARCLGRARLKVRRRTRAKYHSHPPLCRAKLERLQDWNHGIRKVQTAFVGAQIIFPFLAGLVSLQNTIDYAT